MPDFNDSTKLDHCKDKVDRLTNLIAIFENIALDFSKNRAGGDDGIEIGDASEYLMRHFAEIRISPLRPSCPICGFSQLFTAMSPRP